MTKKWILLDRDGTVIVDKCYLSEPSGVELLPGAGEGLKKLYDAGFVLTIVSNQSGIGRGYFSESDAFNVNARLDVILKQKGVSLSGIYFCPHAPWENCSCRKPKTGLAERAAQELGLSLNDIVCMVGDKKSDLELARNLGVPGVLIESTDTANTDWEGSCFNNLSEFADWLIRSENEMNEREMESIIKTNIQKHLEVTGNMTALQGKIAECAQLIAKALQNGGRVFFCGNGGSAADAQHIAAELSGRYLMDRPALDAEALHCNTSALTAVANDFGYDSIFARQIEAHGREGDVLVGISTSGRSPNVVKAVEAAAKKNIKTVALIGARPAVLADIADLTIAVPSEETPRIQEMHILIGHTMCEIVEKICFYSNV